MPPGLLGLHAVFKSSMDQAHSTDNFQVKQSQAFFCLKLTCSAMHMPSWHMARWTAVPKSNLFSQACSMIHGPFEYTT